MTSKYAILGGGPSAAYALQGLLDAGIHPQEIVIYGTLSPPPKGAFWFHWIPDSINVNNDKMLVIGLGDADNYSRKMWGKVVPTSFPEQSRYEDAFSPREGMRKMFIEARFLDQGHMTDDIIEEIMSLGHRQVFCTFAPQVIKETDLFQKYRRMNPTWSAVLPEDKGGASACTYDGNFSTPWVRTTLYEGVVSVEFPGVMGPEDSDYLGRIWNIEGAVYNVPDIHPDCPPTLPAIFRSISRSTFGMNFHLIGRFATYERKALSHDAYGFVQRVVKGEIHV